MIFILLPAFNEEKSLHPLMEKLEGFLNQTKQDYKIIACNDGSSDKTIDMLREYARKIPMEIIEHSINRGLGESSRDLFEKAVEIGNAGDVIIRMDCDDTHESKYIPDILRKLEQGYDVVVASRFEKGGGQMGVNGYRAFISRGANLFMKIFFPIQGLKEYSCGYRGYRYSKIKEAIDFYGNNFIQLKGLGFTCTLEKLVKLKLIGARFGEIPFLHRYDQKQSESKMVTSITTLGYIVMTVIYYWPWGGWKSAIRQSHAKWRISNDISR
jgi:dolichol-phosphate mannosyltransferase